MQDRNRKGTGHTHIASRRSATQTTLTLAPHDQACGCTHTVRVRILASPWVTEMYGPGMTFPFNLHIRNISSLDHAYKEDVHDLSRKRSRSIRRAMVGTLDLPVVDLASSDVHAAAKAIRKACVEYGFFYVVNHEIEGELMERVFAESKGFFEMPMEEKMVLRKNSSHRGYTAPLSEKIDASSGDLKESFYIGPLVEGDQQIDVNQWPSKECFPSWEEVMKLYRDKALATGKRILSLIALCLDLDVEFFQNKLSTFIRLLHYPGQLDDQRVNGNYGAAAHSDYGMITILSTDGTPGLQICREKDRNPQVWEDVHHVEGALTVNIGDLLERWTNCVFRSTLHRVISIGKERYSVAFFIDPSPDLVISCLESCCSEAYPARFPPITSGDYLDERLSTTYKLATI